MFTFILKISLFSSHSTLVFHSPLQTLISGALEQVLVPLILLPAMLPLGGRGDKHIDRSLHPGLCSQRARVRRPQASVKQNKK